jgi:DNA polymerase-1
MRVLIVDAMNIGHIMFHSMGELDFHGRYTGVIFGFLAKVLQLAERFNTKHFVFAWDSQQSLRRHVYEAYKDRERGTKVVRGTGEVIDYQALHDQMQELYNPVLGRLGFVNVIRWTGLEADDVIGAVVKYGQVHPAYSNGDNIEWVIVSTDRDLYQLLGSAVRMYNVSKKEEYTERHFKDEYGIEPSQWVEAKAMGGCYTDNIAGISGIADPAKSTKSRALKILRGELKDGYYVEQVNSQLGQFVINRNRLLVQLPFMPKMPVVLPDMFNRAAFLELFDQLGFTSFLKPERWKKWEDYFELAK